MHENLKMRSMVDKVFVSFKTSSNDPIMDMNMAGDNKLLEKPDADGNTQDIMLIPVSAKKNMPCDVDFCWPFDKYK
ncbi:hypothetical protein HMPREF1544_12338 [Mucor circinelloides 1006PhL]|uniref:Uncharacterized protein n=1 Tax=Mucor circinelloides f. circinelloides (strain 1006PhL) TaxID=1220926 RepID=S2JMH7_MUCC1|nr:hypothetical protein HMPREF1544_12338 [Mucor circinelloides 1006PhL]